jgi:NAD-dependent SIR2 family protein deacetylase
MGDPFEEELDRAAEAIVSADALVIGAGAGMGVDSGLPDFRGRDGFWQAYPPYAELGLDFASIANPRWFQRDPALAWGFYGHRLGLYRQTRPHAGFAILRAWADRMHKGAFVYTSNVDGQFQRAGFDASRIVEVHGAIDQMQCLAECGVGIFPAEPYRVVIDSSTMRAEEPLPDCPGCGGLARPNILMFGDWAWDSSVSNQQSRRFTGWLGTIGDARLVVVECGAGTAIPTIRYGSEELCRRFGATIIRINVRDPEVPDGQIGIPMGASAALHAIQARIASDEASTDRAIDRREEAC